MNTGPQYVSAGEAEKALGVERRTLIRWAEAGQIKFLRPGGTGHWRFDISSVGQADPATSIPNTGPVKAIYARVSTRKQLPDLQNQIDALKAKYPDHVVFSDCASGLNFKRKGLLSLLQLAFDRRLQVVRVAYRDRICRFAYDLIEHILTKHGAKIEVENNDQHAPEQELAEDVVSIITVFGARLYGSRSGRARKAAAGAAAGGASASGASGSGGAAGVGGNGGGGAAQAEDPVQAHGSLGWAAADLQGAHAPDDIADQGAEAVFLSGPAEVQPDKRPDKRRRTAKQGQASERSVGHASA
jgi:excisionase family DNA binding protein